MQITPELQPELGLSVTEAARRAQIISATIATIADLGYPKTSFARIRDRAGLSSTRIITYHFGTKAGLMQAVMTTVLGIKQKFLIERAGDTKDRREMLRAHIETEVAFLRDYPQGVRVLTEIGTHGDDGEGWSMSGPVFADMRVHGLARQFKQGQQEGVFGEFTPEVMSRTIAQAIDGAAAAYAADPDIDLDGYGRELADMFERATAPRS
jgi:AcrR family transcriptional regulator